ncbi:hypothetical protein GTY54_49425 [Streptomyces sp. SID625]|nr:hypothetical protein [Streptomyces sp. SID625]MYR63898.1 hypothetical protein [Streptomyces sp. SID625]
MTQGTDLQSREARGLTDEQKSVAAEGLALAAAHLASMDPGKPLDGIDLAALVGAKVYDAGGRSGAAGGARILRAALVAVGEVPAGAVREDFAVPVAQAARSFGYDWAADGSRDLFPSMARGER